ncbi:MAG TPA: tRNA lysidine(34) synthetase TilS [Pirellulales bacterium]|jgi:tRNA(Ile)-lysidine synthase
MKKLPIPTDLSHAELPKFVRDFAAGWPASQWCEVTVVLAVSGGPDSVALLRAMSALKRQAGGAGGLVVAHFDHQLRANSGDDAKFVRQLAAECNLPFELGQADVATLAEKSGDGIESAARAARYAFLEKVALRVGARYVATGHTACDQVETVLFNLLRGTGLAGLAGIERARLLCPAVTLLRPMLSFSRQEVLRYLSGIGQEFRTDPSNLTDDFTRNRVRNELLPLLRERFNPEVDAALERLAQLSGDAQAFIEQQAEELLEKCVVLKKSVLQAPSAGVATPALAAPISLNLHPLLTANRHLVREMFIALWRQQNWPLQQMGFAHWETLADFAQPRADATAELATQNDGSRKRCFPGGVIVQRLDDQLALWQSPSNSD